MTKCAESLNNARFDVSKDLFFHRPFGFRSSDCQKARRDKGVMKILKFGGTSLGSAERIKIASEHVRTERKSNRVAVVASAMEGVTDQLLKLAALAVQKEVSYLELLAEIEDKHSEVIRQLIREEDREAHFEKIRELVGELRDILQGVHLVKEISPRTRDLIMSFGERLSAYVFSQVLAEECGDFQCLDAREVIKTDHNFGAAKVEFAITNLLIKEHFSKHGYDQVITGFIASTSDNQTTTLGRGGSDYTAAIIGAALGAQEIQIWTDVDGVMTADPRVVRNAFSIERMTYLEAMELTHFGANVIFPPTMQPALDQQIPIRVKNTFNPKFSGSVIANEKPANDFLVTGITSIPQVALIRVEGSGMIGVAGISQRLFGALAAKNISVTLITQASSEHSICFAVSPEAVEEATRAVEEEFSFELLARQLDEVKVEDDLSIIAVVGENMRHTPGLAGKVFQALGHNGVNVVAIAQGSSEINISTVISSRDRAKALGALHDAFFLSKYQTLNLFLIGTGAVGSALLGHIQEQAEFLREEQRLDIRVIALARRKKSLFCLDGISLDTWEERLDNSEAQMRAEDFVLQMKQANLPNSIFVDCTDSDAIASLYKDILSASISVVTPNKKANSGPLSVYHELKQTARRANVKFFYETNVGAGLPVINTLNDLRFSGDEILKIEAVLSGTLSFIFNSFTKGKKFSEVVKEAKSRGYTEPDPRDDLTGEDVARKLLILAREMGLPLEEEHVSVENLVPEVCKDSRSVEEFFELLSEADEDFEKRCLLASEQGRVLRYIGKIENVRASVSLEAVEPSHPFSSLSGTDNMISFTTARYKDRPLVVKGPGAGTDVTSAGVLADIIRVASYLT